VREGQLVQGVAALDLQPAARRHRAGVAWRAAPCTQSCLTQASMNNATCTLSRSTYFLAGPGLHTAAAAVAAAAAAAAAGRALCDGAELHVAPTVMPTQDCDPGGADGQLNIPQADSVTLRHQHLAGAGQHPGSAVNMAAALTG